jgi:hypothetical protein
MMMTPDLLLLLLLWGDSAHPKRKLFGPASKNSGALDAGAAGA